MIKNIINIHLFFIYINQSIINNQRPSNLYLHTGQVLSFKNLILMLILY